MRESKELMLITSAKKTWGGSDLSKVMLFLGVKEPRKL